MNSKLFDSAPSLNFANSVGLPKLVSYFFRPLGQSSNIAERLEVERT